MKHKFTNEDKNTLIQKFRDRAGKIYGKMSDGSMRRLSPVRRWRGKSERRQVLNMRREYRALAEANR